VKRALRYTFATFQRPRGKPTTTWLSVVKKDFNDYGT